MCLNRYDSILKGQPWYSVEKIQKCRTVRDFDRYIASQMDGFNSEKDYYEECSSIGKFHLLPVPLFAFNATDDPIQYGQCMEERIRIVRQVFLKLRTNFSLIYRSSIQRSGSGGIQVGLDHYHSRRTLRISGRIITY